MKKVADKTYYLNADLSAALPAKPYKEPAEGEAFDETPEGAAYMLVREGQEVTDEMAERYGIEGVEPTKEGESDAQDSDESPDAEKPAKSATKKAAGKKGK